MHFLADVLACWDAHDDQLAVLGGIQDAAEIGIAKRRFLDVGTETFHANSISIQACASSTMIRMPMTSRRNVTAMN